MAGDHAALAADGFAHLVVAADDAEKVGGYLEKAFAGLNSPLTKSALDTSGLV